MEHLLRVLEEVLADERVALAYLFGSGARGMLRPDSDLDVAFVPTRPLSLGEELALQGELARRTGRDVDLVRLDHADPLVRWQVARDGVLLRSEPSTEAVRFRARAALEHAELAPLLEDASRRFRRHLEAG